MNSVGNPSAGTPDRGEPSNNREAYGEALSPTFYDRDTVAVARDLIGHVLVHRTSEGLMAGIIVETEAYGPDDPASHAFRGQTRRNSAMYGAPGIAYVYRIYGMYWCMNAVTQGEGIGEAVLIRALEPLLGLDLMQGHRGITDVRRLCSGPGRLCDALGITGALDGLSLAAPPLFIAENPQAAYSPVAATRIGISQAKDRLWRFCASGSPYLSRKP